MAQVFLFAPGNRLPAGFDRGALVGIIADQRTGAMRVRLTSTGDAAARVIDIPLGHGLLWKLRAAGSLLQTAGTTLTDARPWPLGGGEEAIAGELNRARAALPGAPVVFWALGDPAVRAQLVTEGNRRGISVVVLSAWEHKMLGVQMHPCTPGEQPLVVAPVPRQPDVRETPPPGASAGGFPWLPAGVTLGTAALLALLWYKWRK
jgi:hypothetical protein